MNGPPPGFLNGNQNPRWLNPPRPSAPPPRQRPPLQYHIPNTTPKTPVGDSPSWGDQISGWAKDALKEVSDFTRPAIEATAGVLSLRNLWEGGNGDISHRGQEQTENNGAAQEADAVNDEQSFLQSLGQRLIESLPDELKLGAIRQAENEYVGNLGQRFRANAPLIGSSAAILAAAAFGAFLIFKGGKK